MTSSSSMLPGLPVGRRTGETVTAPDGSEVRLLLGEAQGATRCSVVSVRISAGAVSRPVRHRTVEEVWYVTAGAGEVWRAPPGAMAEDIPPVAVTAGDALAIPAGWVFQFRSDAGAELEFLCVTMPPWPGMSEAEPAPEGGRWAATLDAP